MRSESSDTTDEETTLRTLGKGVLIGVGVACLFFILIYSIAGVWPPFISVVSGSMEPNIEAGSLVVVTNGGGLDDSGVVEAHAEAEGTKFGYHGDVIVFEPSGGELTSETLLIHRVMLWVEEGENWYVRANESHLPEDVNSCVDLQNCPAPNDGYITKGDANPHYDQAIGFTSPVNPSQIHGVAVFAVPALGWVRLFVSVLVFFVSLFLVGLSCYWLVRSPQDEQ